MLVGYARVSTHDQNLNLQTDALREHGCEKIFTDHVSGGKFTRKGLEEALEYIRPGDTLVVWKLDRLGRSLKHLIEVVNNLHEKGIGFQSLRENMDTTSSGGKLIFHVFGALAEFEREIIRERTQAGLTAARARGKLGGRPRVMDEKKIKMAQTLMQDPNYSVREICETLQVSKATLYRHLKKCPGHQSG
ncbi:MAG: recombinase family protein [Firmicutes bacterium]|uniref:Resolvase n=1 Tax=Paludifilum halophilum TaxID=1642702 RepID=A0A235B6U8_9BACL|nr:recombinase family protein [Paludifilum halophilum]MDA8352815.1 recombinase family protein [Bacillota bacterium]OYD07335.1 resolvase [Paludifilum halophilum]